VISKKYNVAYADPPWTYDTYSIKGKGRSQEAYYDTLPVSALTALPVREMMADKSVLLLWVPKPMLQRGFEVIGAWGFQYKTNGFLWVKLTKSSNGTEDLSQVKFHFGLGFWTRANPEQCLLATRSHPKRLNADVPELIVSPVREHSRKPDEIYDRIERLVAGPYVELFARQHRPNWDVAFSPEANSGPGKRRWSSRSYPGGLDSGTRDDMQQYGTPGEDH
jgi:N6-adenosine-specific RNA methylase IME4